MTFRRKKTSIFTPIFHKVLLFITLPWLVMLIFYYFGPISYRNLSFQTYIFLFSTYGLFLFGFFIGKSFKATKLPIGISEKTYRILVILGLIGSSLLLLDTLTAGYSIKLLLEDPIATRLISNQTSTTLLTTISYPFSCLSFSTFSIGLIRFRRNIRNRWTFLGLSSILPFIIKNMVQGGRQSYLIIILLTISIILLDKIGKFKNSPKNIIIFLFIISFIFSYFLFIAVNRHEGKIDVWQWMISTNISSRPEYHILEENISPQILFAFYNSIFYYSHQLQGLDAIILSNPEPLGLGRGILGWPLSQIARTGIDLTYVNNDILYALWLKGENLWGWNTGFAVPLSDFGIFGTLIFVLFSSIFLGLFVTSALTTQSYIDILNAIWIITAFVFSIQFFPGDGIFYINILIALTIKMSFFIKNRKIII